jgi:hypothetical protein
MIGYEHTGVRNIIQGVLLGHLLHTISYTHTIPSLLTATLKKGTPRWRVLYRITRQFHHLPRCGSFSQKIETANHAQLG